MFKKKKQVEAIPKQLPELPKSFMERNGLTEEPIEEIQEAISEDDSDLNEIQNKIDQLKAKVKQSNFIGTQAPIQKEKYELIKRVVTVERTFLRNNETNMEYELDGSN